MEGNIKAESLIMERRGRNVLLQQLPICKKGRLFKNWSVLYHLKQPLTLAPTPVWLLGSSGIIFLTPEHKT